MAHKIEYLISQNDKVLRKRNAKNLQLSLFEDTYERHYNEFEKHVAWYLDEREALKWWHRMVAKQDYYLPGWQKRKVYPDFIACVNSDGSHKVSVLETKGDHLKGNDDIGYKGKLFELLEKYANNPVDVGTVETASKDEEKMVFRILMETGWE